MKYFWSILLFAISISFPLPPCALANDHFDTYRNLVSIVTGSNQYYGEIETFPPNSKPFKIYFTTYDPGTSKFKGTIKFLEEGQAQIEINGSVLGNEMVFTEAGKKGIYTLSIQNGHKVKGLWRGTNVLGDEITRDVWFAY